MSTMWTVILVIWSISATVAALVMWFAKKIDEDDQELFDDSKDWGSQ